MNELIIVMTFHLVNQLEYYTIKNLSFSNLESFECLYKHEMLDKFTEFFRRHKNLEGIIHVDHVIKFIVSNPKLRKFVIALDVRSLGQLDIYQEKLLEKFQQEWHTTVGKEPENHKNDFVLERKWIIR